MKIILIFLFACSVFSCTKMQDVKAVYAGGCGGPYILIDGIGYPVCNKDELKGLQYGDEIKVSYRFIYIEDCPRAGEPQCLMLTGFPIGDWVEVRLIE